MPESTSFRHHPALRLLVAVLAISFAAIFFRLAGDVHPLTASGLRLVIAGGLMAPVAVFRRRGVPLTHGELRLGARAGALYAVHFGAWVWSLQLTSVASSVTLVTATPLMMAVWGVMAGKDVPGPRLWWALALSTVGILLISGLDLGISGNALLGDLLALVGAVAMGLYLQLVRASGQSLDVWTFSCVAALIGGLLLLVMAGGLGVITPLPSPSSLGWLFMAAILPQVVGHTLLTAALKTATPTQVAIATVGEPVGSTLLAWWILSEAVAPGVALGCGVTLCGVLLALTIPQKKF